MVLVAIVVVSHVCANVCVVVAYVYRSVSGIVNRVVTPHIRRVPSVITVSAKVGNNQRSVVVNRLDDVVRTIEERRTDDLDMVVCDRVGLCNDCSNVLVNVYSKSSLDNENVGIALDGLDHAEIIYITVAIEVEVGDHVLAVVEEDLKFTNCR